jgi:quercetin dioxygenase-like cupin family protein
MTPSTTHPGFDEFRATMLAPGYTEVLERTWAAGTQLQTHAHPFDANALVTHGEMWLEENGVERRLVAGDTFDLARDTPHSERYGPQGATYWVARR